MLDKTGEFNLTAFGLTESDLTYPEPSRFTKNGDHQSCPRHGTAFQLISVENSDISGKSYLKLNPLPPDINPDTIVYPVLITGAPKSGKSYLANKLLGVTEEEGFQIDGSINPCTQGIWGCLGTPNLRGSSSIPSKVSILYLDCESLKSNSCKP